FSIPGQRGNGDFRANAETEAEAEADALVDVKIRPVVLVQPSGKAARVLAQGGTAQARHMDLPTVRVAAEHQVAAAAVQPFDGAWIVGENDARNGGAEPLEGLLQV